MSTELTCYKSSCPGTFEYLTGSGSVLYKCDTCGSELGRENTKEIADMGGPLGELAGLLLEGGSS